MRRVHFEAVGLASALLIILALSAFAQHHAATPQPSLKHAHGTSGAAGQWEGSPAGKAYSEFNHRLAGVFVLLIGLSELRGAMGVMLLAWTRFLLPAAMLGDRKSTRLNSSHLVISYAVFCLKKKRQLEAANGAGEGFVDGTTVVSLN